MIQTLFHHLREGGKLLTRTGVALLLVLTLIVAACTPKQLSQAAEAAKDIGGGTRDVVKAVREAYEAKLISIEQKDRLAELLKQIARGGQKGVDAIDFLQKHGVTQPTPEQSRNLSRIFDDEVVAPFLNLLTELGKLSDESSVAIRTALASVRTAIVVFSAKIGRMDVIRAIEAREVWNV